METSSQLSRIIMNVMKDTAKSLESCLLRKCLHNKPWKGLPCFDGSEECSMACGNCAWHHSLYLEPINWSWQRDIPCFMSKLSHSRSHNRPIGAWQRDSFRASRTSCWQSLIQFSKLLLIVWKNSQIGRIPHFLYLTDRAPNAREGWVPGFAHGIHESLLHEKAHLSGSGVEGYASSLYLHLLST